MNAGPADLFAALWGGMTGYTTLHHISSNRNFSTQVFALDDIAGMTNYVAEHRNDHAYYRVCPMDCPPPKDKRGDEHHTSYVTALFGDWDFKSDKHRLAPPEAEVRSALDACPFPPSVDVETANGVQRLWLLDEPVAALEAKRLLLRLSQTITVKNDRTDLASVLRLPGSNNNGTPVRIVKFEPGLRYSFDDLDERLPKLLHNVTIRDSVVATSAEVTQFFDAHTKNRYPGALTALLKSVSGTIERIGGRHDSLRLLYYQALRESRAGAYPAQEAIERVTEEWLKHIKDGERRPRNETASLLEWQLPKVLALSDDEIADIADRLSEQFGIALTSTAPRDTPIRPVEATGGTSAPKVAQRPEVMTSGRHLNEIADEFVTVLCEHNKPPTLFGHADGVALLEVDKLRPIDSNQLLNQVERRTRPVKAGRVTQQNPEPDNIPAVINRDTRAVVLNRLGPVLPPLLGLANAPYMRPDGTICTTPGYDTTTKLYLLDSLNVEVPDTPSAGDLAAAVALIDELLEDFPLPTPSDRAHAFSALLTPAVRHLVPLAPLHFLNGNSPGVGKNLLVEILLGVHLGYRPETDPLPGDDDEMRKQITAHFAEGRRIVIWDEAHYLIGRQLARLLTTARWSDRVLGTNATINAKNILSAYALGNNAEIIGDLRRRVIRINLETELEQPSRRTGFKHTDLRQWADGNRAELLGAVLTLLRGWHCARRPTVASPMGSFEPWCNIVGGTLAVAGVDGFMSNAAELLEGGDTRDAEVAGHLSDLAQLFHGQDFTIGEVLRTMRHNPESLLLPGGVRADSHDAVERLGKLYRSYRRRPMPGGNMLDVAGKTGGRTRWRVITR